MAKKLTTKNGIIIRQEGRIKASRSSFNVKNVYFSSNFVATLVTLSLKVRVNMPSTYIYNDDKIIKVIYYIGLDYPEVRINNTNFYHVPKGIAAGNTAWAYGFYTTCSSHINPFGIGLGLHKPNSPSPLSSHVN